MKKLICLAALSAVISVFAQTARSNEAPVANPPQFIVIGSDDNTDAEALLWMIDVLNRGRNHDGSRRYMSFYVNTNVWNKEGLTDAVLHAYNTGHEVGNHTHSHIRSVTEKSGNDFTTRMSVDDIYDNIKQATDAMIELGIPKEHQFGFRTPFLAYGNETFEAMQRVEFLYDCSIESGWDTEPGTYSWPYTLDVIEDTDNVIDEYGNLAWDNSDKRNWWGRKVGDKKPNYVGEHPGLWLLIATSVEIATEDRNVTVEKADWMGAGTWLTSGLDYNIWDKGAGFALDSGQTVRALMHTVEASLNGNRAPFNYGVHSQYYFEPDNKFKNIDKQHRAESFREFVKQASQLEDVWFVSGDMVIRYMENPVSAKDFNPEDYRRDGPNEEIILDIEDPVSDRTTSIMGDARKKSASATVSFKGIRNGQINLALKAGNYSVELYNLQGRLIQSVDLNAINGVNATGLRTDGLSKGTFILNVKQEGSSVLRQKVNVR